MRTSFFISAAALALSACGDATPPPAQLQSTSSDNGGWSITPTRDLNVFFDCLEAEDITLVSAHRGGAYPGYPENAIETMAYVLERTPAMVEVDVATSADGVLYLMHDDTLDRTTTGSGDADALNWFEIKDLRLEDKDGAVTDFNPPRFDDALAFAKSRTIMQIDFKQSTRFEDVVDEVKRQGADNRVVYISYSMAAARKLHRLHPEAMISLSVNSQSELNRAVAAGVPADRLIGFTGIEDPRPRLFSLLNDRDVEVIFGTLGGRNSIDREIARTGDETRYDALADQGVDIIATDRPLEAHSALEAGNSGPRAGLCGIAKS